MKDNFLISKIGLGLFLFPLSSIVYAQKSTPNIVFILADDMGYGDVSALNPEGKNHHRMLPIDLS